MIIPHNPGTCIPLCNNCEKILKISSIGLPAKMTKDDAYIQGMADGINEVIKKIKKVSSDHSDCPYDENTGEEICTILKDIKKMVKEYE